MVLSKLTALALGLALFFGLFVFGPFYDRIPVQVGVLAAVTLANVWRTSLGGTWRLIKFCIPFVLTLSAFGLVFHLSGFLGRDDWLRDTALKALIFPSSLIYLKLILSFVTYLDLLRLPIPMARRVDLITFKAALSKGGRVLDRFKWYLESYPQPRGKRKAGRLLRKYACLIMALYLYLYEEIENSHQVMDNRLRFLSPPEKGA